MLKVKITYDDGLFMFQQFNGQEHYEDFADRVRVKPEYSSDVLQKIGNGE